MTKKSGSAAKAQMLPEIDRGRFYPASSCGFAVSLSLIIQDEAGAT